MIIINLVDEFINYIIASNLEYSAFIYNIEKCLFFRLENGKYLFNWKNLTS